MDDEGRQPGMSLAGRHTALIKRNSTVQSRYLVVRGNEFVTVRLQVN